MHVVLYGCFDVFCYHACWNVYCDDNGVDVYVHACYIFIFIFIVISFESQSVMYGLCPGFYIIHVLYWWILCRMHGMQWDKVTTFFLNIVISGLWSVITFTSLAVVMEFFKPCKMLDASCSMLLYQVSVLDRPLLANSIGQRIVLSDPSPAWQFMSFFTCKRLVPRTTVDASVLRYRCFFTL